MATKRFDKQLHIMVTDEQYKMLYEVAAEKRVTPSELVRGLILHTYIDVFGEKAVKPPKRTRRGRG